MKKLTIFILLLLNFGFLNAQTSNTTRILFIFDESNSMNAAWEDGIKIDIARNLMIKMLDSIAKIPNMQVALRMYGHQYSANPQNCSDTKLEVPFSKYNINEIKDKLRRTSPKGTTPIAKSLLEAGDDFPPCKNCTDVIILLTDGIEACAGDPCAIALQLKQKGIELKPYVIGIGLDLEIKKAFECFGDHFLEADDPEAFEMILETVVTKYSPTGETKVRVDLLDVFNKATETNVNLSFFDNSNGNLLHNYIHTLNGNGIPDQIMLDYGITYKMIVNTIPQVVLSNIHISQNTENIISVQSPQGSITLREERGNKLENIECIIRKAGNCKTENVQNIRKKEKYLVGKYDIEIHTLPITHYKNIQVKQSEMTTVIVPEPGVVNIAFPSKGFGSLYVKKRNRIEWVCNLNNIGKKILLLQPGNYVVIYRPEKTKTTSSSRTKEFTVKSGYSEWVRF